MLFFILCLVMIPSCFYYVVTLLVKLIFSSSCSCSCSSLLAQRAQFTSLQFQKGNSKMNKSLIFCLLVFVCFPGKGFLVMNSILVLHCTSSIFSLVVVSIDAFMAILYLRLASSEHLKKPSKMPLCHVFQGCLVMNSIPLLLCTPPISLVAINIDLFKAVFYLMLASLKTNK